MNLRAISSLLVLEWKQTLLILTIPIVLIFMIGMIVPERVMFSLSPMSITMSIGQWLYMSCWFCFPEGFRWLKQWAPPGDSLEFFFSQPLSRRSLFHTRATLYLASFIIPLAALCFYSTTKPTIKLELPYPPEIRETTREFYLTHFNGAYLQQDPKEKNGNKTWVVLPQGQVTRALAGLAIGVFSALLTQCLLFACWRKPWGFPLILVMAISIPSLLSIRTSGPLSLYEWIVAFTSQHPISLFLTLGVFLLLAQWFCCRRFVNTQLAE